jgi:glycine cleavage system H protein
MVALLILLTILVFMTLDYFIQRLRTRAALDAHGASLATSQGKAGALARPAAQLRYRAPRGVFFSPRHVWLYLEESGAARLGIDDLAQSVVGRISEMGTRSVGDKVRAGDPILELRHEGRRLVLRSPVDGVIETVNKEIVERRDLRGIEPFSAAWIYRVRPDSTVRALQSLLLGDTAKEWLDREVQRLKVILATIAPKNPVLGETLQDGGLPAWGLIDYVDEAEWKQIQEKFFE